MPSGSDPLHRMPVNPLPVHHDGSELGVPVQTPALGDVVPVRIRVPAENSVERLILRVLRDAEPFWVDAVADGRAGSDGDRFFVAEVPVANPVTGYRILVDRVRRGGPGSTGPVTTTVMSRTNTTFD